MRGGHAPARRARALKVDEVRDGRRSARAGRAPAMRWRARSNRRRLAGEHECDEALVIRRGQRLREDARHARVVRAPRVVRFELYRGAAGWSSRSCRSATTGARARRTAASLRAVRRRAGATRCRRSSAAAAAARRSGPGRRRDGARRPAGGAADTDRSPGSARGRRPRRAACLASTAAARCLAPVCLAHRVVSPRRVARPSLILSVRVSINNTPRDMRPPPTVCRHRARALTGARRSGRRARGSAPRPPGSRRTPGTRRG